MIAFDFDYYRPETLEAANEQYQTLHSNGQTVMFYGGGTEFISRARRHEIQVDAVIDLKGIPECRIFEVYEGKLVIGSAVTLSQITDDNLFPLLTDVSRHIATRTERNKITIGGNITSHLLYREGLLPLLLADADVVISDNGGIRKAKVRNVFDQGVHLNPDEFIVNISVDQAFTELPYQNLKQTKHSNINYPIISLAAVYQDDNLAIACSGACSYPVLFKNEKQIINNNKLSREEEITHIVNDLPEPILDDMYASANYRKFVLENELYKLIDRSNMEVSND